MDKASKNEVVMYPRFGVCPYCKTELRLTDEERSGKELVKCSNCEARCEVDKIIFDNVESSSRKKFKKVKTEGIIILIILIAIFFTAFVAIFIFLDGDGSFLGTSTISNKTSLQKCLENAHESYIENWNGSCEIIGEGDGCLLPKDKAKRWDDSYEKEKDRCYDQYGK